MLTDYKCSFVVRKQHIMFSAFLPWLAFLSIIRGLRFRVLGLWRSIRALKDGAAIISQACAL